MLRTALSTSGLVTLVYVLALGASAQEPATQPATEPAPEATSVPETIAPERAPLERLRLELLELQLGFEGSYDERDVRYDRSDFTTVQRQRNRSRRFEETLGLHAAGSAFGESVLQFDVATQVGWTQERFEETRPGLEWSESPHGDLFEYDLNFTLFPRGKLSATAYAQRADSRLPRAFLPSLDRTQERIGGGVFLNDPTLPMRLTFDHTWEELSSRTFAVDDDERRGRDTLRYEATWQIDRQHALRFTYEYDERREQYSGSDARFDTTRHYFTLNHTLRFGPEGRSAWENLARFQDEAGETARDVFELSSRLRLQHTAALSTNYAAQMLRESYQEFQSDTWRGEGGVAYEFSRELLASVQLYGLRQSALRGADFTEWGSTASLNYAGQNDWGRLSSNLSYNHVAVAAGDNQRNGIVIGESVTMRDPLASYLAQTDVVSRTIVVTNGARSRTYLPGRDYLVVRLGRYTALRRVPTGQIADRETVLVSYAYEVANEYDVSRDRVDFRVQQAFTFGLTPYYALSLQDEDVGGTRFLRWRARNANRHRAGLTYRQRRWSVTGEYEFNDDAIDPYEAVNFNGDVVIWQNARHQLDGKAAAARYWFDGAEELQARSTWLCDVGATYRYLLARNTELQAAALYRYEDDSLYGITNGVDFSGAVEWRIGQFSLRFEAEYDLLELPGSRDDGFSVWLKLKRDIPLIARAGS